jgi:hypothetical protein
MNPLDEQIAIKLFGWRWLAFDGEPESVHTAIDKTCRVRWLFPPDDKSTYLEQWLAHRNVGEAIGDEPLFEHCFMIYYPPRFHDNETACFRALVPAMEKRGFDFYCIKSPKKLYRVEFIRDFYHIASGDTTAEAICKAALAALEGEHA